MSCLDKLNREDELKVSYKELKEEELEEAQLTENTDLETQRRLTKSERGTISLANSIVFR